MIVDTSVTCSSDATDNLSTLYIWLACLFHAVCLFTFYIHISSLCCFLIILLYYTVLHVLLRSISQEITVCSTVILCCVYGMMNSCCRPQVTIATAIVFCHRFFLRQSHAKNDRRVRILLLFVSFLLMAYYADNLR